MIPEYMQQTRRQENSHGGGNSGLEALWILQKLYILVHKSSYTCTMTKLWGYAYFRSTEVLIFISHSRRLPRDQHASLLHSISIVMSHILPRASRPLLSPAASNRPIQRVAQVRRHLSATASAKGEIRDAYILSAARTPTGKVTSPVLLQMCC